MFIQSDRVRLRSPLARTSPASWIAPPNSRSFSVKVVLPASGWAMIANVRRRPISRASGLDPAAIRDLSVVSCIVKHPGAWQRFLHVGNAAKLNNQAGQPEG